MRHSIMNKRFENIVLGSFTKVEPSVQSAYAYSDYNTEDIITPFVEGIKT
jgi:hypothetical protein